MYVSTNMNRKNKIKFVFVRLCVFILFNSLLVYSSVWSVYYVSEAVAKKSLSYETNPYYDLNIVCTDAGGATGTPKIFTVNVINNEAPVFTNVFGIYKP